jgi:group I intron endonuclease
MAYIYSITNLTNNKQYIGKTTQLNPYDRWKQHLQLATNKNKSVHSMPICRAINKYGADKFKFRILEECEDNVVNERERYYIETYNTADGIGYNCTYGGEGASKPKKYWSNHPHSKAVSCYTLNGEWVKDYDTRGLAAYDILNRKPTRSERGYIKSCIDGITFQGLGYRWALKGEQPKLIEKRINQRGVVYGINLKLNRKKMWKSQADIAEELTGNRKKNANILISIRSPNTNKLQANGWYLFRNKNDALSDWKPATKNRGSEYYKKLATKSSEKRKKPVYGINIKTGERIDFNSVSEASFFIKGEANYKGVGNIINNIKRIQNNETWCNSYGYRWYEINCLG